MTPFNENNLSLTYFFSKAHACKLKIMFEKEMQTKINVQN